MAPGFTVPQSSSDSSTSSSSSRFRQPSPSSHGFLPDAREPSPSSLSTSMNQPYPVRHPHMIPQNQNYAVSAQTPYPQPQPQYNLPPRAQLQVNSMTAETPSMGVAVSQPSPRPPQPLPQNIPYYVAPRQGSHPPIGIADGLAEDFSSLSFASVPGSIDPGIDWRALPRPLDDERASDWLPKKFPMNCDSRYFRLTTNAIPSSGSLASRWHLPLGAVVCPLAEPPDGEEVPILNYSCGIVRCRRCRTYVNPYVTFTDGGSKWKCNICFFLNDVPGDYFAYLDANGQRTDLHQRPELMKGSIDFIAPLEYMVRPPMPPVYLFLIDVSISAVRSGMIEIVAQTIKSCLNDLLVSPRTQIGFITFDSTIHFYNMESSLSQPQMVVITELDDIFLPLPNDLLVNLAESRNVVETFLDVLPSMFLDNVNVESAFGPALKAAFMVMSQTGGKLLIFQNSMPSLGIGRLKLRGNDPNVYGTDKEHTLRLPEDSFYKQMSADFTKYQIGINIYAFGDKYIDIASIGSLAKYTGGQLYYYPSFQSTSHGEKLRCELRRDLTRETAWEAVMRIRCGKGIRFSSFHGNFMLRSSDLLALPATDCDKAYAMQLSLEEALLTTQEVYFQVALLYTASCGERRIRVHTAAAPVVSDLGKMYAEADVGAIVSLLSRLEIERTLFHKVEDSRSALQLRIVKTFREYRNLFAVQHRLGGRFIYPESLKCLPLYGLALSKSIALRGGLNDTRLDESCATGLTIMALPVKKLLKLLYPSLIRIDQFLLADVGFEWNVKRVPLTVESLDSQGLYVYDDGFCFILWFGKMMSPDTIVNLLGPGATFELSKVKLKDVGTEMGRKLMVVLGKVREGDSCYHQFCHLVRQGDQPREGFIFLSNLLEDHMGGMNSYVDWLLQIHRQVQQNV